MGFGVIQGEDGMKFKTRAGKTVKLLDLLNEAREYAFNQLKARENLKEAAQGVGEERGWYQISTALKPEEYEDAAEKLGIASIKYNDLKQNRISDYIFSF
jgi:arginyl-tRNA synthetase